MSLVEIFLLPAVLQAGKLVVAVVVVVVVVVVAVVVLA